MTDNIHHFGYMPDGSAVLRVELRQGDLKVNLLSLGALVQSLYFQDFERSLVLGFAQLEDYLAYSQAYGITAGRVANRIKDARYLARSTENKPESAPRQWINLDRNFNGRHCLHGGSNGIGKRNWQLVHADQTSAQFKLIDADQRMGFPGTATILCHYRLLEAGGLEICYDAACDDMTPINLAHHSYFKLDDQPTILDHQLHIPAANITAINDDLIPTGELLKTAGLAYDFNLPRTIKNALEQLKVIDPDAIFDHNYCLSDASLDRVRHCATLSSPHSGISMRIDSDQAGLQFYAGHKINSQVKGMHGKIYAPYDGLCLEPQCWPDFPNQPHFPQSWAAPEQDYHQTTRFHFTKA